MSSSAPGGAAPAPPEAPSSRHHLPSSSSSSSHSHGRPPSAAASATATAMTPQQYCLRWNNHQHNLLSVFEDLLHSEAFVDVTLACEGLQLKAHKMVLSACSPYFQAMLYNTPDRHPIVFLRDVRFDEMKALLEFMYRGEVSVDQENLSSLLKVAEGLKIKGLADVNDTNAPSSSSSSSTARPSAYMGTSSSSLLSPSHDPIKRMSSPPAGSSSSYVGPKRKRARPRRLSGSEAVPMASGLSDETAAAAAAAAAAAVAVAAASRPLEVQTEEVGHGNNREKVITVISKDGRKRKLITSHFCPRGPTIRWRHFVTAVSIAPIRFP